MKDILYYLIICIIVIFIGIYQSCVVLDLDMKFIDFFIFIILLSIINTFYGLNS